MTYDEDEPRLTVRCRSQSGSIAVLPVLDVSPGGFMVPCSGWEAQSGERVLATISGFSVRPGILVWMEDGRAGIAFDEVLHEAVYDQMRMRIDGTYVDTGAIALQREMEEAAKTAPKPRYLG